MYLHQIPLYLETRLSSSPVLLLGWHYTSPLHPVEIFFIIINNDHGSVWHRWSTSKLKKWPLPCPPPTPNEPSNSYTQEHEVLKEKITFGSSVYTNKFLVEPLEKYVICIPLGFPILSGVKTTLMSSRLISAFGFSSFLLWNKIKKKKQIKEF